MPDLTPNLFFTLPSREENGKWTMRFTREGDDFVPAVFWNGKGSPSLSFRANMNEVIEALMRLRNEPEPKEI